MAQPEGPFDAPNRLESALMKVVIDPAQLGQFLHRLVDSKVHVIGWHAGTESGPVDAWNPQVFRRGDRVAMPGVVRPDGTTILPFYSSLRWLTACTDRELRTLAMGARDLLDLATDATLFLNYGAPWGKEFPPEEVAGLLAHGAVGQRNAANLSREIHLGVREPEPIAITAGVAAILEGQERVTAAYLGTVRFVDEKAPPHLVIGLDGQGDIDSVTAEVAKAVRALAGKGAVVDLVRIERGGGTISDFLVSHGLKFYGR